MDDLISREALLSQIHNLDMSRTDFNNIVAEILVMIKDAPVVGAVSVVHGEWIECDWVEYNGREECVHYPKEALRCSKCHHAFKKELLWKNNFCPNCGAGMKKKVQE